LNEELTQSLGREVISMEVLSVRAGQRVELTFESARRRPQGVYLETDGVLRLGEQRNPNWGIWSDVSRTVELTCEKTRGILLLYNIYDSGRPLAPFESLMRMSGMLREDLPNGAIRYRCNDMELNPKFDSLVFTVQLR